MLGGQWSSEIWSSTPHLSELLSPDQGILSADGALLNADYVCAIQLQACARVLEKLVYAIYPRVVMPREQALSVISKIYDRAQHLYPLKSS